MYYIIGMIYYWRRHEKFNFISSRSSTWMESIVGINNFVYYLILVLLMYFKNINRYILHTEPWDHDHGVCTTVGTKEDNVSTYQLFEFYIDECYIEALILHTYL